jgi:hypothetical protein
MLNVTQVILDRLARGPLGRQILEEAEAELLTERAELAAKLAALEKTRGPEAARLRRESVDAANKLQAAMDALKPLSEAQRAASAAEGSARIRYETERGRLERELRRTAPDSLSEGLRTLAAAEDHARRNEFEWQPIRRQSLLDVGSQPIGISNADGLMRRIEAIRSARGQLEALQLSPESSATIDERVAAILSTIPAAGSAQAPAVAAAEPRRQKAAERVA